MHLGRVEVLPVASRLLLDVGGTTGILKPGGQAGSTSEGWRGDLDVCAQLVAERMDGYVVDD